MSDGWEITTKSKTKYVLEWNETFKEYSQRDGAYNSKRKKMKDFINFDELNTYYLELNKNVNNSNIIGYKMEWLDLDKHYSKPGYRSIEKEPF